MTKHVRVSSQFPIYDAANSGHRVPLSRALLDVKNAALKRRFKRLDADGRDAHEANLDEGLRTAQRLAHLEWVCDAIADDISALASQKRLADCRDAVLAPVLAHLTAMAELSTGIVCTEQAWREALDALHRHAADLVANCLNDAALLTEMELVLERISLIERQVANAIRVYIGYITT